MIDLTGKTALVTGGTRGIGRACALRLAEAGADVIVNYLTSQTVANEVAEQIQQMGCRAATVKADIGEDDDVQEMLHFVEERFGGLDILVSNAATGGFRMLMDSKPQHFEAAMNTNTRALISLTQAARGLLERKEGRSKVIALSSHGSRLGLPAYGLIGASKAALESLVRSLAYELGNAGINFNVVLAGLVETDSTRHIPGAKEMFAAVQERLLVGDRALTVEDVADAVLLLSSPLSDLVQGQTLVVDGGISIRG